MQYYELSPGELQNYRFPQEITPHSCNSLPDVKVQFDSHFSMLKTPTQWTRVHKSEEQALDPSHGSHQQQLPEAKQFPVADVSVTLPCWQFMRNEDFHGEQPESLYVGLTLGHVFY